MERSLENRLRELLLRHAREASMVTYRQIAESLEVPPPRSIHQVTQALESLMAEAVAAGRPFLAALCVSRLGHGLPARGFCLAARKLGLYAGEPVGPEARAFHESEVKRLRTFYRDT